MFAVPSAASARASIAAILTGNRARSAAITATVAGLVSKWSLAALDASTFGFYNAPAGTAWASIVAGSAVLSSTDAVFTAADAGKSIDVSGAGPGGTVLSTSILSYQSPTQVTLAAAASTTVDASVTSASGLAVWGYTATQAVPVDPLTSSDGRTVYEPNPGSPDINGVAVSAAGSPQPRTIAARLAEVINVKDYGAAGDGVTDDTAAIQIAANALPSGQQAGVLFFPAGHYAISGAITITGKGATVRGEGRTASVLRPKVDGAYWALDLDASSVSGCSFDVRDLGVREIGLMNSVSALRVRNCYGPRVRNVSIDIGGKCIWIENCNDINVSDCVATSLAGDTVLRLKAVSGCVAGVNAHEATNTTWGSGSRGEKGPCLWLSGLTTSLQVTGCKFQGGGSSDKAAVTSITSTGANFTVTRSAHSIAAGEWFFIDGCSVAAYNGMWKADSVGAGTLTVLSTANPGPASDGVCGRLRCTCYIDAADGPVNEVSWSNCLFEGWYTAREIGAVSVYANGVNAPTANGIINHTFAGCYCDYGQTAFHLQGVIFSGTDWSVRGITISGGVAQYAVKALYLSGCQRTLVSGLSATCQANRATASDAANASAVHIDADGTGVHAPRRVRLAGCEFGPSVLNDTTFDQAYGIWIAGTTWDELFIAGCTIFGRLATQRLTAGASMASKVATVEATTYGDGATMTAADVLPSVASAATIAIGMQDTQIITGTTTINTMNGGWPARVVYLTTNGAVTFTGGNIATSLTTTAGQLVIAMYDGTAWHLR